jgi:putative membrane protein
MTFRSYFTNASLMSVGRSLAVLLIAMAGYCTVIDLTIEWWEIHLPTRGSAVSVLNTVILGLLMGFRNRVAYARWWEARGLWGQLTNDSRNLAAKLAAFLPAEILAEGRVSELLVGFAEALRHHLRGDAFRLRDLPGFEQEKADPPHVPLYLAGRLYALVAEWKRAGYVDEALLRILDQHLRGLLDVCGACEKIRTTPLAPSYKSLLRLGLFANVLAAPWFMVPDIGLWSVPVILLVAFFLLGVELIDSIVEEPFGREKDDLDLDRYCRTIRDGVQASLPYSSEATSHPSARGELSRP